MLFRLLRLRIVASLVVIFLMLSARAPHVAGQAPSTYCNPINVDYGYCPIPNFVTHGKHRATADPVVVNFRGDFYLFSTNQWGYWWSEDLRKWTFVPRKFLKPHHQVYDELCAPAAFVYQDALYVIGSTYADNFTLWKSTNPRRDEWTEAVPEFKAGAWDPAFLVDDNGKIYLYHGSSNAYPLYGQEVDAQTMQITGTKHELWRLQHDQHGWERFGEANDNTFLRPFLEGAWVTKHAGKYYLQYSGPGTEFSGYADGVAVGEHPLGPFKYQQHNPFSYKPGGFARGAGHGAMFQDRQNNWWHTSTMTIAVKNNFERRIGIWPAGFDGDGILYCDTSYGDYPWYLPDPNAGRPDPKFSGWMLLNYAKPVQGSSTLGGMAPNLAVDEDIRTYWSAKSGDAGEWFLSDLGEVSTVHAIQINYADQDAEIMGKQPGLYHQYRVQASPDGTKWKTIIDKSDNREDVPHDYVELSSPVMARYLRLENVHVPTGKFAISGFRVFGRGGGKRPEPVKDFVALRGDSERRNAWLKWQPSADATGYVIRVGIAPDKLYTSVMVYSASEYYYRAMSKDTEYYFQIEAFNENGVSERTAPVRVF